MVLDIPITRVAETLKRLGYVEFDDIKTETVIKNNTRQVTLVITVHNTPDFDRLYKEHEDEVKKRNEERQKKAEAKKEETKKPKESK